MRIILSLFVAFAFPLSQASPTLPQAPASSKVWIGHYAEYEQFLKTADIQRLEGISVGVTNPRHAFFAGGGLAASAAWKPLKPGMYEGYFESYRSEIAAYKLDRLLELDMVPPTVERNYKNDAGSLQLWIENTRTLKQIQTAKIHSPDVHGWNVQIDRQKMFDDLVADIDDNQGNMLIDRAWNVIKVDHSRAFTNTMVQPFEIGRTLTRIDRPFFERVKTLDRAAVQREIGDLLEGGAVGMLMARRDAIVKAIEKLAAAKGAAAVFAQP